MRNYDKQDIESNNTEIQDNNNQEQVDESTEIQVNSDQEIIEEDPAKCNNLDELGIRLDGK